MHGLEILQLSVALLRLKRARHLGSYHGTCLAASVDAPGKLGLLNGTRDRRPCFYYSGTEDSPSWYLATVRIHGALNCGNALGSSRTVYQYVLGRPRQQQASKTRRSGGTMAGYRLGVVALLGAKGTAA